MHENQGRLVTQSLEGASRMRARALQRMASLANLREQVILEVLLLGLRVSDASRLEKEDFDRLN